MCQACRVTQLVADVLVHMDRQRRVSRLQKEQILRVVGGCPERVARDRAARHKPHTCHLTKHADSEAWVMEEHDIGGCPTCRGVDIPHLSLRIEVHHRCIVGTPVTTNDVAVKAIPMISAIGAIWEAARIPAKRIRYCRSLES